MKVFTIIACLAAACASAAYADVSRSGFTYSPLTIVCDVLEADVAMGTYAGGVITVSFASKPLLNASPGFGMSFDKRRCKRVPTGILPKPVVPRPSYRMGTGEFYECATNRPVVIHAHFLRRAGRLSGLYVSVRLRPNGRWVAAGLVTFNGQGREYIGPTCVGR